jgi:hypothetical protein
MIIFMVCCVNFFPHLAKCRVECQYGSVVEVGLDVRGLEATGSLGHCDILNINHSTIATSTYYQHHRRDASQLYLVARSLSMVSNDLGDEIAKLVIDQFRRLPSKSKPIVRASGVPEWVPLAGVVIARGEQYLHLNMISISNSTQRVNLG